MKIIKKQKDGYARKITLLGFLEINYKSKRYSAVKEKKLNSKSIQQCKIKISKKLVENVKDLSHTITSHNDPALLAASINRFLYVPEYMNRVREAFGHFGKIDKGTRILEIGSGMGTSCLCAKAMTGAQIIGLEPAPQSYKDLHKCIKSFKEANPDLDYEFLNCSGEDIPLKDGSIDFIYCFEVLEHVQNPHKVLEEIYRLLKKGGKAYIATCNYDSFYEGHYKQFWNPFVSVEKNRKRFIRKGLSPIFLSEVNFITKNKIIKYVKEIGFSKIEFDPIPQTPIKDVELYVEISDDAKKLIPPKGKAKKPVWRARFIQSPIVCKFLKKFNREYKLYFTLEKSN